MNFIIPADFKGKIKESEKIDKCMDLAKEPKKLWNMSVMMIPIVVGALGTIPKGLERLLKG